MLQTTYKQLGKVLASNDDSNSWAYVEGDWLPRVTNHYGRKA